jgi:hypothetical protein
MEPAVRKTPGVSVRQKEYNKIDEIVLTKAGTSEAHLVLDGLENPLMSEHLSKGRHFSHPGWHGGFGFRRNLDGDGSLCHRRKDIL